MDLHRRSATSSLIRRLNLSAVLDLIREHSPISRSEIARRLNISMPTVMRVVAALQAQDLVRWTGDAETSGGRPRNLLELNTDGYAVVGLDLGGSQIYGTVADLGGQVQAEIAEPWRPQSGVDQVCEVIASLLAHPRPADQQIRGIGVGAPGVTLSPAGIVTWAPSLGWRDLPLGDILRRRFNLPIVVENDVNLAALGEFGFGAAKGASSAVCIAAGTGLGAGIIIERKIYRGYHHSAGEVGYLPPGVSALGGASTAPSTALRADTLSTVASSTLSTGASGTVSMGASSTLSAKGFGALEEIVSSTGIELRALRALRSMGSQDGAPLAAADVFAAAANGQAWASELIAAVVDHLAFAVAAVSLVLDPEVIVLGGSLADFLEGLIGPIQQRLVGLLPTKPNLVPSKLGRRAAVLGAILLILDLTTEYVAVHDRV